MAQYYVTITSSSFYDPEMGVSRFTSVSPSITNATVGDTVQFRYLRQSGGQSYVDIVGYGSIWSATTNTRLYHNNVVTRTLTSAGSDTLTANFPSSSFIDRNFTVNSASNIDTTPDSFDLGAFVTTAERSTVYKAPKTVTVSGLSSGTSITASITNGVFTVNDTNYSNATSANKSVSNGDSIRVWHTSSSSYSTSVTTTLDLNGVTDIWRTTTIAQPVNPQSGTLIPLGITSGSISMGALKDFYGRPNYPNNTISMSELYKGGSLVPNITQNSSVPTSGVISLSNLYGSHTSLFWDKEPVAKHAFTTAQGSGTMGVTWNWSFTSGGVGDFDVGYGLLKTQVEYRWVVTTNSTTKPTRIIYGGTTYTGISTTHTTPWDADGTLTIELDHGAGQVDVNGTAMLECRKVWNGSTYTISSTTNWSLTRETLE